MSTQGYGASVVERVKNSPLLPGDDSIAGRVALECRTVHVENIQNNPTGAYSSSIYSSARTGLGVPLLKDGVAAGVIVLFRYGVKPFSDRQIALVQTFADQAVIAIENTCLFEAEQARTKEVVAKSTELTQSLKYQTAISELLGVISRSSNELQPVFNTIVTSSKRLLRAHGALVTRVVGQELRLAAFTAVSPESDGVLQNLFPMKLDGTDPTVAAVRERIPFVVQDSEDEVARRRGFRSILIVPMLSNC